MDITQIYSPVFNSKKRSFISFIVPAGKPKMHVENEISWLDLNDYVCRNADTLYVRVEGDSMIHSGINDGDLLVVDRQIEPRPNDIIVARIGENYTVKLFNRKNGHLNLVPSNCAYKVQRITEVDDFEIVGVVTYKIENMRKI